MGRMFMLVYGEGYVSEGFKLVDERYFVETNGFMPKEREAILGMEMAESRNVVDFMSRMSVVRVK